MNTSFSYTYSLLLHGLMNSYLIFDVHFIEFINATNAVVSEHQGPGLYTVLTSFNVFAYTCREARRRTRLARCINAPGQECSDVFQKLRFGGGWVTHDANVDVAAEFDTVRGFFGDATEELQ